MVRPGADLKDYALPPTAGTIAEADWIIMASIRDSTNWFLSYSSVNDSLSAFTTPGELKEWFRKAGYSDIQDDTTPYVDQIVVGIGEECRALVSPGPLGSRVGR